MAFEVPPLPYDYNALEPHIDEQTMRVHHDKHHQAYVDNANAALEGTELEGRPVECGHGGVCVVDPEIDRKGRLSPLADASDDVLDLMRLVDLRAERAETSEVGNGGRQLD